MSAFALKHRDEPLRPYADPAAPTLKLGTDGAAEPTPKPAPEYVYNPITEVGTFAPGTTPPKHIIDALRFNPPEAIASKILTDLCRPDCSLQDIAERANTTLESLTLWMTRPDISARLDGFEAAIARHARLGILACVPCMIDASARILREYQEAESDIHGPAMKTVTTSCRNRQTALDAQKLLLRLYHTFQRAAPQRASRVSERCTPSTTTTLNRTHIPSPNPSAPASSLPRPGGEGVRASKASKNGGGTHAQTDPPQTPPL